jgi:hypothetical protein
MMTLEDMEKNVARNVGKRLASLARRLDELYGDEVKYPYFSGEQGQKELAERRKRIFKEVQEAIKPLEK